MVHWQTGLAKAHQASFPAPQLGFRLKETFLVTGSQDCTVKLWPIPKVLLSKSTAPDSGPVLLQAQATQRCHDKVSTLGWQCGRALTGIGVSELPPVAITRTSTV